MTREIAIKIFNEVLLFGKAHCTQAEFKELAEMSIKALEQEQILDKIRAEIEQERVGYPPSAGYYKAIIKCLQIIDKYRAESGEE